MHKAELRRLPWAVAAMTACLSAHATYASPDGQFNLSGFGTLGAAKTSTRDAGFNYPGQGGGADTTPGLDADSKLAVQGTYKFMPTLSGTAQVMTKFDAEGQYIPKLEWAFAKWQALPALSIRAGRIGAPFFMISDFRDVGYANTTARPALDVYAQVLFSQFEGADVAYQHNAGPVTLTTALWTGQCSSQYALAGYNPNAIGLLTGKNTSTPADVDIKRIIGLNLQAEFDNGLSLRLGHMQGDLTTASSSATELKATANFLSAQGLLPPPLASQLTSLVTVENAKATFSGLGIAYDSGDWLFNGEFTRRRPASFVSDTTGYYTLVGYRVGKWTPFAGWSKLKTDRRESNPLQALKGGAADALYQGTEAVLNTQKMDQRTTTLGTRWDVMNNVALKGQWDRVVKPADSSGTFFAPNASFVAEKRTVHVLTLSVDFVF